MSCADHVGIHAIAVMIDAADYDEECGGGGSDPGGVADAVFARHLDDGSEAIARRHDGKPWNDRIEDQEKMIGRRLKESELMENMPDLPHGSAEYVCSYSVEEIVSGDDEQRE